MCGIAGIFERDTDNTQLMSEMLATIEHRGPDDQSIYTYRDFTLGHRRLSIIDISACGNQPIFNEDKSICVIFNGEIYNYEEIREELKSKGHVFYTATDTEVLVHLYEEYGTGFFNKLNGIFAFALLDQKNNRLVLARDHFGVKPLHYFLKDGVLVFGSKGFEHRSSYDSKERLVSDFAGIKQCTVYVETLDNSDLVSRIIVEFPKQERWEELFDNYKNLKSMLMEKYGNFSSCVERFQNSYIRTDEDRMRAVHMGECMYKTNFSIAEGDITLSIDYEEWRQGFVVLKYQDKINSAIIREAAIEDL